jgi:DUF438 domain-containing protein
MQVFDQLLVEGIATEKVKASVGKILNVFYKSLSSQTRQKPEPDHFLSLLMRENREVEKIMAEMKLVIKQILNHTNIFMWGDTEKIGCYLLYSSVSPPEFLCEIKCFKTYTKNLRPESP